jgi:hypothetical protein
MANRAVIPQGPQHHLRILNLALRATSTKIGVLGVSSIHIEKHNYSPPSAVRTDRTPVDFAYPPVTPVSEVLDLDHIPCPYRSYKLRVVTSQHSSSEFTHVRDNTHLITNVQCDDGYPPNGLGILDRGAYSTHS